jgi:hypothetical protein
MIKRWQDDVRFVGWLYLMQYAEKTDKGPRVRMSNGVILYMFEAWVGGQHEH